MPPHPARPPLAKRRMLLSLSEVADLVDRHPNTVRRWAIEGRIPMEKVASSWAIGRIEFVRWFYELARLDHEQERRWMTRIAAMDQT